MGPSIGFEELTANDLHPATTDGVDTRYWSFLVFSIIAKAFVVDTQLFSLCCASFSAIHIVHL